MGLALELVQGTAHDFQFQLPFSGIIDPFAQDYDQTVLILGTPGSVVAGVFADTDTLAATVWAGADETPLLTPAATWIASTKGQVQVTFANTDTAALAVGQYYLQAFATRPAQVGPPVVPARTTALLPRGTSLEILAASGTSVPRPTYITITDVRKIAPWIDDLQVPDNRTGFDDQLADSRDWIDEVTLRNYRGGNVSLLGYHGFALDAWYTGGGRRTSLTNRWLKAALVANQLLITPRIKNICAYYALSRICETFITKSGQYVALASRFRFEAESLLASTTVEIDVNGDGYGEVPINLSSTNTLWA